MGGASSYTSVSHTAVLLGENVYVGGGFEGSATNCQPSYRLDVYNLTTNKWSSSPITTSYCHFAMTTLDDKLVTAGGKTKNEQIVNKILIHNDRQWKDYSEMPTARYCATAIGHHSMLIVIGGFGGMKVEGEWIVLSTTELLDATNGCWYTCGDPPSPHQQLKAANMNNKLYLFGGYLKDLKSSVEVFVASLDTLSTHQLNWKRLIPNTPWFVPTPVVLYKFLLTVGGGRASCNTSEVNVLINRQWRHLTNIPAARSAPAVVGVADKIIVMGGVTNDGELSNTVWVGTFK